MRGTKKWSEHKDVFNLHLQRGLKKSHKRLILAPCTKTEASTKSQLNRNHWCFSCVLSGNNLPAWSRTTSLELPKWRQNDRRRRRHQLSNGRVSDLNDLHADYSKFSNNCVFCPEIKGTRHNCLEILENKVHQQNCRANHIQSTKNCVKESPSPRDVLLGFFSEDERWKIWFLPMQLTATKRKPIYML